MPIGFAGWRANSRATFHGSPSFFYKQKNTKSPFGDFYVAANKPDSVVDDNLSGPLITQWF